MNIFFPSVHTALMKDHETADYILTLDDPREMKQEGRNVRNFDQKLWDENCQAIVEKGNIAKVYDCFVLDNVLGENTCEKF